MSDSYGASAAQIGLSPSVEPVPVSPAVAASIPSAAWLIEMTHNDAPVPRYWNHSKFKAGWVWDANEAMRFCREQDARDFLDGLAMPLQGKPVEHLFLGMRDPIVVARECFLNFIADARRFDEEIDGDETGMSITYFIESEGGSFGELVEALGIKTLWQETAGDAVLRWIGQPAQAIEARSDATGTGAAEGESAVTK